MTETPDTKPSDPKEPGVRAALRVLPFSIYVLANATFMTGTWMQRLAVGWMTWQLTQSELWLGLISACEFLPSILLGPFAGLLADRVRPLPVVLIGTICRWVQACLLTLVAFGGLASPEILLALMVMAGLASGMVHPSRLSLVADLVPRPLLQTAIPIDSLGYNIARFIGPAIGGVILLQAALPWVFLTNVLFFTPLVAVLVWLIRRRSEAAQAPAPKREPKSMWQDLKEGLVYVVREPRLAPIVLLLAVSSVFLRPVLDMLPAFTDTILKAGPTELATLVSAYGVGSVTAGFSMTLRQGRGTLETWHLSGALVAMVATLLFLQMDHIALAALFAFISGGGMTVNSVAGQTILQTTAQSAYRGRVMSLYSMLFLGGPAIGSPLVGILAERLGLRHAFDIGLALNAIVWCFVVYTGLRLARQQR